MLGCSEPVPLRAPLVEVSDSAGVRLVRVPPLGSFEVPEVRTQVAFSTSRIAGGELDLYRVTDALFLRDSSLVIANSGYSELIIIDKKGEEYRRSGGQGDGPGEFRGSLRLLPAAPEGFLAFDWRLSLFDEAGQFVETRALASSSAVVSVLPLAVFEDQRAVAVAGVQRIFRRDGVRRDTVPLLVFAPGGSDPDTLGVWMGLERSFSGVANSRLRVPIGFARTASYASNGTQIVIGSTDSLDLRVYSEALVPILRVVASMESRIPTEEDVAHWLVLLSENLPRDDPTVRRAYAAAPVRNRFPGFDGLKLDSKGRIWVGEYLRPSETERRWVIFAPSGEPVGQVRFPASGFASLPGRTELLAVGEDRVALLRRNRFDGEYVEVWTLGPGL